MSKSRALYIKYWSLTKYYGELFFCLHGLMNAFDHLSGFRHKDMTLTETLVRQSTQTGWLAQTDSIRRIDKSICPARDK
jgi:hypothetical protein